MLENNYNKLPSSVNEQLAILQNRGMLIDDEYFARNFLKENYFYRFLNYSVSFFNSLSLHNDKHYRPGTCFTDVAKVYKFDSELRLLILKYILSSFLTYQSKNRQICHNAETYLSKGIGIY